MFNSRLMTLKEEWLFSLNRLLQLNALVLLKKYEKKRTLYQTFRFILLTLLIVEILINQVMYLADDIWGKKNITRNINFISALGSIFGVPYYAPALTEVLFLYLISFDLNFFFIDSFFRFVAHED